MHTTRTLTKRTEVILSTKSNSHLHLSDNRDQVLDLTSNSLQGHIPESLGGMTDLRELWLGCDNLHPKNIALFVLVRFVFFRSVFSRLFVSPRVIPRVETAKALRVPFFAHLLCFDSGNNFVGVIPETLSKLDDLQSLDLSRNKVRVFTRAAQGMTTDGLRLRSACILSALGSRSIFAGPKPQE